MAQTSAFLTSDTPDSFDEGRWVRLIACSTTLYKHIARQHGLQSIPCDRPVPRERPSDAHWCIMRFAQPAAKQRGSRTACAGPCLPNRNEITCVECAAVCWLPLRMEWHPLSSCHGHGRCTIPLSCVAADSAQAELTQKTHRVKRSRWNNAKRQGA